MRNPDRQPGPTRRNIIAQPVQTVGTNPALRVTAITPGIVTRNRKAVHMSGPNNWHDSMYLRPGSTAMTSAWSRTVSD